MCAKIQKSTQTVIGGTHQKEKYVVYHGIRYRRKCSYSRGAFYSHYNSKEDFLMSIIDEEILKYIDIVHDSIKDVHAKDSANWVYNVTLNLFEHYTIIRKSIYNVNNIRLSLIKTCCFYNNNTG